MVLPDGPLIRSQFSVHRFNTDTKALWTAIYHNRQTQLGNTATIVNFGDESNAGLVSASTFTGASFHSSGLAPTWTPNEALNAWDTPFLLGANSNWQQHIPVLTFNGTDEEMDTPDADYWSRALAAFSIGAWINPTDATSSGIMGKINSASNLREWAFTLNASDKAQLLIYDENDAVTPNAAIDTEIDTAITEGSWSFVVFSYDGTANASGIDGYVNGALVASTDTDDANFVSSRNTTSVVQLGRVNSTNYFDGKIAGGPCGPFFVQAQLSAEQIANMFRIERLALGV